MAFARAVWHILVGIKDALALILLLAFFGAIAGILSNRPNHHLKPGALLLRLDGTVVEQPAAPDPIAVLTGRGNGPREYSRRDLVAAIDHARTDERVKAIVLDLDGFMGGGQVALSDVGAALDRFRATKKPVLAYATAYTNSGYQLAAHASEIWTNPLGGPMIAGPGSTNLYFKDALDKLGVDVHIYRVGTYKSAVEPFMLSHQSPAAAEAERALMTEMWGDWQAEVHRARPQADFAAMVNNPVDALKAVGGDLARLALNDHLVDRLGTRDDFARRVAAIAGAGERPRAGQFATIGLDAFLRDHPAPTHGAAIGVLTIAGEIIDGKSKGDQVGGATIAKLLADALADDKLKALVVRVDSPGGSVLASEQIRTAILAAKAKHLPVVVSMGNLAASGGYWVSTPGDVIFAEPATITGSIGIFGIIPSFEKGLAKLGIHADGVKTTALAGQPDLFGGLSPAFSQVTQMVIDKGYGDFLARVAASRHKTPAQVDAIGQGRVWAGGTARQLGLVDRLGTLADAMNEAARRAGVTNWHADYIEKKPSAFARMLAELNRDDDDNSATDNGSLDLFGHIRVRQRLQLARAVALIDSLNEQQGAEAACIECAAFDYQGIEPARTDSLWRWMVARWLGA